MYLDPIYILSFLIGVIIVVGMVEYSLHQRAIRNIPVRVHVNGARGKSSVVRLIAAGLNILLMGIHAKILYFYMEIYQIQVH